MTHEKHQATIDAMKDSIRDMCNRYPVGILPPEFVLSAWQNFQRLYGREWSECPTEGAGERGRV